MAGAADPNDALEDVTPLLIDVENKLDGELSLSALARQFGYSPFHFHRLFSSAVGETPKQHVHRLRLERAAYKLAVTAQPVFEIALAVGFNNHETFSRAFKRSFGYTPRDYRQASRAAQAERLKRNRGFRGEGCLLSDVRFVSLPPATLIAIRRHGAYSECPVPFHSADTFWNELADWAQRRGVAHRRVAYAISYDDPTVTPPELQRLDACLPVAGAIAPEGRIRRLDFQGGWYAGLEHSGPYSTMIQAYRGAADGIRRSGRYVFDEGPPLQIYRRIYIGGDPAANLTEVYFPVRASN
jgi:AraC family transcriptional regulator